MYETSVIMAVCEHDDPKLLFECLKSLKNQSYKDFEVIITSDGPTPSIFNELKKFQNYSNFPSIKFYEIQRRSGPAQAWNNGINRCKSVFVVRMDPDDIARPHYLETQVKFMKNNPSVDIAGALIEEFNEVVGDLRRIRVVPLAHRDIVKLMNFKNCMNHVTVIMRVSSISCFRYEQFTGFVDYFFWLKLKANGKVFQNNNEILVDVRVGNNFLMRRSGYIYALRELKFVKLCYQRGYFNAFAAIRYAAIKPLVRLMPKFIIKFVYSLTRDHS